MSYPSGPPAQAKDQTKLKGRLSLRYRLLRLILLISLVTIPFSLSRIATYISAAGWNLVTVEGQVTYEDEPVVGAKVLFVPQERNWFDSDLSALSYARTDAKGRFRLQTLDGINGAVSGRHLVFITTKEVKDPNFGPPVSFFDLQTDSISKARPITLRPEAIPEELNQKTEKVVIVSTFGTKKLRFDLKLKTDLQ